MKKIYFLIGFIAVFAIIIFFGIFGSKVNKSVNIYNQSSEASEKRYVIKDYKREKIDAAYQSETVIKEDANFPVISSTSQSLLKYFEKDISNYTKVSIVHYNLFDEDVTRVITESAEIDFDKSGNIVSYKNLDDFSGYKSKDYILKTKEDLDDIINKIEEINDLSGYELVDCSSAVVGAFTLSWIRDYGNGLLNNYDNVNVVVDATDGSIMLFGRKKVVPDSFEINVTEEEAKEKAKEVLDKYENETINTASLNFFRPNFAFEDGAPYKEANFIRLAWQVTSSSGIYVQIDAETGEVLGGDMLSYR